MTKLWLDDNSNVLHSYIAIFFQQAINIFPTISKLARYSSKVDYIWFTIDILWIFSNNFPPSLFEHQKHYLESLYLWVTSCAGLQNMPTWFLFYQTIRYHKQHQIVHPPLNLSSWLHYNSKHVDDHLSLLRFFFLSIWCTRANQSLVQLILSS